MVEKKQTHDGGYWIESCPFCGHSVSLDRIIHRGGGLHNVVCGKCVCSGPLATSRGQAVSLWNKRLEKVEYDLIDDGGHRWLKVPKDIISKMGQWRISDCSYMDNSFFYLEEDFDMKNFINLSRKEGKHIVLVPDDALVDTEGRFYDQPGIVRVAAQ